jgi:hypothetical protein
VKALTWREAWIESVKLNQYQSGLLDEVARVLGCAVGEGGTRPHSDLPSLVGRLKRERDHACESGVNRAVYEELERERDRLMEEVQELRAGQVLKLKVESA